MSKTAFLFAHNGHVGGEINPEGKFINEPKLGGQLGCVIHTDEVKMTKEAKDIIMNAGREGGSFSSLMLTNHGDGSGSSIGIMGMGKVYLGSGAEVKIGRDCELSVLDHCEVVEEEVPEDFVQFIESAFPSEI